MFSESFGLMVGNGHALAMRNDVELDVELIREEQFLLFSGLDLTDYERERLNNAGVNLNSAHEVDSSQDLEALVSAGFGIAVAPKHALRTTSGLPLNLPSLDLQRTVAVYTVAGRPRPREAAAFLNLLRCKDWNRDVGLRED